MERYVEPVDVWAAKFTDEPGSLAILLNGLRDAGADLDFVIARRAPEDPGTSVVFVTPLRGDAEIAAAANLGFNVSSTLHAIRVEADNQPGMIASLVDRFGPAGISLRGVSAAVIGPRVMLYVGLDTAEDAERALELLQMEEAASTRP